MKKRVTFTCNADRQREGFAQGKTEGSLWVASVGESVSCCRALLNLKDVRQCDIRP